MGEPLFTVPLQYGPTLREEPWIRSVAWSTPGRVVVEAEG
jgi:hypothetical protein